MKWYGIFYKVNDMTEEYILSLEVDFPDTEKVRDFVNQMACEGLILDTDIGFFKERCHGEAQDGEVGKAFREEQG